MNLLGSERGGLWVQTVYGRDNGQGLDLHFSSVYCYPRHGSEQTEGEQEEMCEGATGGWEVDLGMTASDVTRWWVWCLEGASHSLFSYLSLFFFCG